jgi:CO/xanthine dehydrogenase Mo-binding subunit
LAPDAPRVHAGFVGNVLSRRQHVAGDPDKAFAMADHVLHLRIRHNRLASVAMEPRGIPAEFDASQQRLTVWPSTQAPFLARGDLSRTLGVPEDQMRVMAPDVGGGFGAKVGAHCEDVLVCHLALQLRQPVAWVAGGAAQGIGEALMELVAYGPDGQLPTGSLLDYAVPRADAIPELELDRTETPTPGNILGAKGVGESATVGTPAAIASAVLDALRPLDLREVELPITEERVWRLLQRPRPGPL